MSTNYKRTNYLLTDYLLNNYCASEVTTQRRYTNLLLLLLLTILTRANTNHIF